MKIWGITLLLVTQLCAAPVLHGVFIQPSLNYGGIDYDGSTFGSQEHFDTWIQSMADVGVKHLFYQWSSRYQYDQSWYSSAYNTSPDAAFAYYAIRPDTIDAIPTQCWSEPTNWPGAAISPLERTLSACEKAGVKLWFGLYLNEGDRTDTSKNYNWWNAVADQRITGADSVIIEHHVRFSLAMIDDIAAQFGKHPAFGGVYCTMEIANNAFIPQENHAYLADVLGRIAERVHRTIPGGRVAISPFFNTELASAAEFGAMWTAVLQKAAIDVLILQDGVGVVPATLTGEKDLVTPYFKAVKRAVEGTGTVLWANAELFTQDVGGSREDPKLIPTTIGKLKQQLERETMVADTVVSFGFHYMDPNPLHTFTAGHMSGLSNEAELRRALYQDYKAYYESVTVSTLKEDEHRPWEKSNVQVILVGNSLRISKADLCMRVVLYTLSGREVASTVVASSDTPFSIPVQALSKGVYLLAVHRTDGSVYMQRVHIGAK